MSVDELRREYVRNLDDMLALWAWLHLHRNDPAYSPEIRAWIEDSPLLDEMS